MSIQKHKTPSGTASANSNIQIRKGFLKSSSIINEKTIDPPHSYYYLFEDDDYATLGRNVSEFMEPKTTNTINPSKGKKS
jgi:hypothetical protein